jgi:hypothetical protein
MTPEQKLRGAFDELDELLREGMKIEEAVRTAADNNGLTPSNFRAVAEKWLGDLEKHRRIIELRADRDQIAALTRTEIPKCWRREGPYRTAVGGFFTGAEEAIAEAVVAGLGRPLTEPEVWIIEDMWDESFGSSSSSMKRAREWKRSRSTASVEQPEA